MDSKAEKLFVVESDSALREHVAAVLKDAGYEVSTAYQEGMKAVLAFNPDVVLLGADPPQLDCCDLLSEIKGSAHTQNIRVIVLAPGGPAERTRALDLGADDVLSVPFDSHELLSRVRSQMRSKHAADAMGERLRITEENRTDAQQVVAALKEERHSLRTGSMAAIAVFVAVGLVFLFLYRHTEERNTRAYAAITKLQIGVLAEQQLMQRTLRARGDAEAAPAGASSAKKPNLEKRGEELRTPIGARDTETPSNLQNELSDVRSRVHKLETEGKFAQAVIQSYEPSVCLIHVAIGFRDHTNGLKLHYAGLTSSGKPTTDTHNNPLLSFDGSGPEVRLDVFGTGFLASADGEILTNHHVVEPWWQNDEIKQMIDGGIEPVVTEMTAYFPGVPYGIAISTLKVSPTADVAIVKGNISKIGIRPVVLTDGGGSAISGEPVLLLGYPTAIDAILARTPGETLKAIATASQGDPKQLMEELARRNLIRPITTQGHIGDVLPDKIIYDAATTVGGSGGPLFNEEGKVVGINFAMMPEFSGSNFAVPVRYGKLLLKP